MWSGNAPTSARDRRPSDLPSRRTIDAGMARTLILLPAIDQAASYYVLAAAMTGSVVGGFVVRGDYCDLLPRVRHEQGEHCDLHFRRGRGARLRRSLRGVFTDASRARRRVAAIRC